MEVMEEVDDLNVVKVVDRTSDVTGRFEIDTASDLIDIHYGEVTGTIWGDPVTVRAKK